MAYTTVHTLNDDVKFLLYRDAQRRMTGFDDTAFIHQGLGTADPGLWRRIGKLCGLCYDSFLFICHSSLDSLPYLRTVLRNALRLNAASFLYAVHGSLIPFPPSFYGRPFLTRVYLNAISSLLSHCPSIPFISTLALTLRTLLGPCAGSPRI